MKEVTISEECPTLSHRFHLTDSETLVVSFFGQYRDGSYGNPDAHYMRAMINLACDLWFHRGLVIDLSALKYEWGDLIDYALDHPDRLPTAIVVGPWCHAALASLWAEDERPFQEQDGVFENLQSAVAFVRSAPDED